MGENRMLNRGSNPFCRVLLVAKHYPGLARILVFFQERAPQGMIDALWRILPGFVGCCSESAPEYDRCAAAHPTRVCRVLLRERCHLFSKGLLG
jgi:hypothetical protein